MGLNLFFISSTSLCFLDFILTLSQGWKIRLGVSSRVGEIIISFSLKTWLTIEESIMLE